MGTSPGERRTLTTSQHQSADRAHRLLHEWPASRRMDASDAQIQDAFTDQQDSLQELLQILMEHTNWYPRDI